jgi:hypothetical protein
MTIIDDFYGIDDFMKNHAHHNIQRSWDNFWKYYNDVEVERNKLAAEMKLINAGIRLLRKKWNTV